MDYVRDAAVGFSEIKLCENSCLVYWMCKKLTKKIEVNFVAKIVLRLLGNGD